VDREHKEGAVSIAIGERRVDDYTSQELIDWFNNCIPGNKLRKDTARIWVAVMHAFDEAGPPMTVRQMYYALVSAAAIPKTEGAYNRVVYHLLRMRREGIVPYTFIADNTRWIRKPDTWASLEDYLKAGKRTYRRALWDNQDDYVEVWCEKDALAGVLYEITSKWDVPLMVTRGYPSETFVYNAAEKLRQVKADIHLHYFGDHDPSGRDIPENTERKLRKFGANFYFHQEAVLPWQIKEWNLPTRPTKRGDSRAKGWEGGSVELDAIPVATLRELVEDAITWHINEDLLKETREAEEQDREALDEVIENAGLA
jgi:hypothetical protein